MKTARFLLACLAISALAACGTESVTAPEAPSTPNTEDSQLGSGGRCVDVTGTGCVPILGSQLGSGG